MSLRAALRLALQDGARGAVRGAQRTASGALDRTEGALVSGAQLGTMIGAPLALYPAAIMAGVDALPDTDIGPEDWRGLGAWGGVAMGGMGALGALSGLAQGRSAMLRMGARESAKAFKRYIRHLRRVGLHEEAARAEAALSIGRGESHAADRALLRMERAPNNGHERRVFHKMQRLADEEMRDIARAILRDIERKKRDQ